MEKTFASVMNERFGKDSLIALATVEDGVPSVRTIDAVYRDGAFYAVTHMQSKKMKQIERNPVVAVCGEWFTGHGTAQSLGHILRSENAEIAAVLRRAFAAWYDNGHTNEQDPNTCILKITLTDGLVMVCGEQLVFPG